MLNIIDAFDGIAVDVDFIEQTTETAYKAVVEWFGAPQDSHWPCDITQGRFSACAWSWLTRRYTIFIDREQTHACQIVSVLGHEMYHRVAGRRKTLRRQLWIDELLAFSVQQRFLREQGFEANAEEVDQRILQSTVAVDFNRLHQARAKRIRLGLGGIRYPQDFVFMIGRLSLALNLLLE